MANEFFQNFINQMKDIIDKTAGVIDESGHIIACSDLSMIGQSLKINEEGTLEKNLNKSYSYKLIESKTYGKRIAFVQGNGDTSVKFVRLIAVSLAEVKKYHDDKYDKCNFMKNVILENVLPGDVYVRARELRLDSEVNRVCLSIKPIGQQRAISADMLQELFPEKEKDFVINTSKREVVVIKEIGNGVTQEAINALCESILDVLSKKYGALAVIGIGTVVNNVQDLPTSFKEAELALEVATVFFTDEKIISYYSLGIARLVYQLPRTLCEMFLKEVFRHGSVDSLDNETLFTIQKFFANNLNVSETSRKLFIHRNTLVYRLEKIKKLTGLDLRDFEDSVVFRVAMMVKKYLESSPGKFN